MKRKLYTILKRNTLMHNSLAVKLVKYSVRYTKVSIPKRTFYLIKSEMSLHLLDTLVKC